MQRLYFCLFTLFCALSFFSCTPQKRVQKYAYLFEEKVYPPLPKPTVVPQPVKAEVTPKPLPVIKVVDRPKAALPSPTSVLDQQTARIIQTAMSYQGTPYRYGGMSSKGMDCSGLICVAYQSINRSLPHSSRILLRSGRKVSRTHLQPGHLVFFSAKNGTTIDHVGMVQEVMQGKVSFIHATVSGGVRIDRLEDPYWKVRYRDAVAL